MHVVKGWFQSAMEKMYSWYQTSRATAAALKHSSGLRGKESRKDVVVALTTAECFAFFFSRRLKSVSYLSPSSDLSE